MDTKFKLDFDEKLSIKTFLQFIQLEMEQI